MSAYAIDEIPNLPDKTETVARQKEKVIIGIINIVYIYIYIYIYILVGDKARKWLCGITFSTMLCVVFAILFAVFLSLYIKLNGDYKDIKEENDELNLANESITMQNTELEITNGLLLQENEILNNTLIIITQDAINMNVNITELINILMNDYNTTKTELSLLQSKYDILIEKYQTYGLYIYIYIFFHTLQYIYIHIYIYINIYIYIYIYHLDRNARKPEPPIKCFIMKILQNWII